MQQSIANYDKALSGRSEQINRKQIYQTEKNKSSPSARSSETKQTEFRVDFKAINNCLRLIIRDNFGKKYHLNM